MSVFSGKICILGGDPRQTYLAEYLLDQGYDTIFCMGLMQSLSEADVIVTPVPFRLDGDELSPYLRPGQCLAGGGFPERLLAACKKLSVTVLDLLQDTAYVSANAALTAEGLLSVLIQETSFSLAGCKLLLLGFGHCGGELGKLLCAFDMGIQVFALDEDEIRRKAALEMGFTPMTAESLNESPFDYDLVVNTIPARVLNPMQLELLPKDCVLFDIASPPYGFDPALIGTKGLDRKLVPAPGIPGRYLPKTAGELLGRLLTERILSHGF